MFVINMSTSNNNNNNNYQVPNYVQNNFQTGINIRISTFDYNRLYVELQDIIYKYLLSAETITEKGPYKFIDTGRLEMFLLLLKDLGDTHYLNWEEFLQKKDNKKRAQYFTKKFNEFQSLQLYMIELYQGFIKANRFYGQLITQNSILTPQQVWFREVYEEIMENANEIIENYPPRESIHGALTADPGENSQVIGWGRKNYTIAKLRHYNRKIANLLSDL